MASVGFAFAPNIVVAVAVNIVISATLAAFTPGLLATLSLAIPARARATGFSVASLWIIPGLLVLPIIGALADAFSIRVGMCLMLPLLAIGALIIRSTASTIEGDIAQVWEATAARSLALHQRRSGEAELLLVRKLDAGYGERQVLFDVDIDVREGEIVALLGTNGAGKSTLLKSISGVVEADRGAIILDGRDITHAPPNEIAALGIVQVPGGSGVFGGLTVAENLELAGWTARRDPDGVAAATAEVLEHVPDPRRPVAGRRGRPQRRPAADAGPGDGVRRPAPGAARSTSSRSGSPRSSSASCCRSSSASPRLASPSSSSSRA